MDKTCFVLRNELQLMETDTHSTQIERGKEHGIDCRMGKRLCKKRELLINTTSVKSSTFDALD